MKFSLPAINSFLYIGIPRVFHPSPFWFICAFYEFLGLRIHLFQKMWLYRRLHEQLTIMTSRKISALYFRWTWRRSSGTSRRNLIKQNCLHNYRKYVNVFFKYLWAIKWMWIVYVFRHHWNKEFLFAYKILIGKRLGKSSLESSCTGTFRTDPKEMVYEGVNSL